MLVNEPLLALVAAIFGGAGLKVMESVLSRAKYRNDIATQIREELRRDVVQLRTEVDSMFIWREKYYALLSAFNELALAAVQSGLGDVVDVLRVRLED